MKKIVYLDMDGVIVDFESGINALNDQDKLEYKGKYAKCPGVFSKMKPIEGALEAVGVLSSQYDVYILSSPGWGNASAWADKYNWVVEYLPAMEKRLILSSQKHLNTGDFLVDDRIANGTDKFEGEFIHFGTGDYQTWNDVLNYLVPEIDL